MKKREFSSRKKPIALQRASLYKYKEIEQAHIAFAYPSLRREDPLADAAQVVNTIAGGGMSSRLFQKVREQLGLAYTVYSYISSFTEGGLLTVYAGVNPANVAKAQDAIFETIDDFCREKFTKDEFLRGKEQVKSAVILAQENTASQMIAYGKYMLYNDAVLDLEKRVRDIDAMTMEDCERALSLNFNRADMAASIVGKVKKPLKI